MNTSVNSKNKRYTAIAWILALLVLAIAVPLNLIFDRLNVYIDMTPNSLYTLTDTTEKYLNELDRQGTTVDVYFFGDIEDIENSLELLAFYRTIVAYQAHDCFNFMAVDPDTDPELANSINPDGVYNLSEFDTIFIYGDNVKRLPSTMMYIYQTDSNGNVVSAEFRGENYITSYLYSVVNGIQPTVYFLEGHGEVAYNDMSQLTHNLGNYNYGTGTLNLLNADSVPDDACILVIAGPQYDITDDEYEKIVAFTEQGGNLALFMSPNDAEMNYTNLERLMRGYCIGMDYNIVGETDSSRYYSKDNSIFMVDLVAPSEDSEEDLTSGVAGDSAILTYMPASRSFFQIYGSNYTTCAMDTLIQTQNTAYAEPYGGTYQDNDRVEGQPLVLSMYSIDSLRSYSKMVVFGSADFITNDGVASAFYINPLNLFLATITWMYDSDIDMNIENKAKTYDSFHINSSEEASGMIALFVALPVLVAAAGIVIWLRRKDA